MTQVTWPDLAWAAAGGVTGAVFVCGVLLLIALSWLFVRWFRRRQTKQPRGPARCPTCKRSAVPIPDGPFDHEVMSRVIADFTRGTENDYTFESTPHDNSPTLRGFLDTPAGVPYAPTINPPPAYLDPDEESVAASLPPSRASWIKSLFS